MIVRRALVAATAGAVSTSADESHSGIFDLKCRFRFGAQCIERRSCLAPDTSELIEAESIMRCWSRSYVVKVATFICRISKMGRKLQVPSPCSNEPSPTAHEDRPGRRLPAFVGSE